MLSIIVAIAKNNIIGGKNGLLWKLPADLVRFKSLTMGHSIIMGRKTHESIRRALPGRQNVIITRQPKYTALGCAVAVSFKDATTVAGSGEVFVIGGGEIYKEALPLAQKLYVTLIDKEFEGDVYFPKIDPAIWREVSRERGMVDERNIYEHDFIIYERII